MDAIGFLTIYGFVVIGVLSSIVLPFLRQALPKPASNSWLNGKNAQQRVWEVARPYLIILAASLVVGVLVVAFAGELLDWKTAILAGFTWDSLLQKIQTKEARIAFNS